MTFDYENAVKKLQAKDEIRDLVFSYCEAIRNRDIESLVALYTPDAAFGSLGTGEEALRSMAEATMREVEFAVILVTNHRITFLRPEQNRRLLRTNNQIHRSIRAIQTTEFE